MGQTNIVLLKFICDLVNYPFPAANKKIISALNDYLFLSKDKENL